MDAILLSSKEEVRKVVAAMVDISHKYPFITVGDVKTLVGIPTVHLDEQVGWKSVVVVESGQEEDGKWSLKFPDPERIL